MKLSTIPILVLLSVATLWTPQGTHASSLGISAVVYPSGAHISYRPIFTNAEMDCLWGFVCEGGVPLFHRQSQEQLHRIAGWAQFAGIHLHGRMAMAFELFVSRYSAVSDETSASRSQQAMRDLEEAIRLHGYRLTRSPSNLLPTMLGGESLIAVQHSPDQDLVVMGCWTGSLEIEGIALYDHGSRTAKQVAWASLALQIHLASQRGA